MTAIESNKEIVRKQFELLNSGQIGAAVDLWDSESFNHGQKVGPPGIRRVYESLSAVNEHHTLHEMVAEGDWVAVRTTCRGVHSKAPELPVNGGIFAKLQPTGRAYSVQHMHLFRVANGKIKEHWANRDDLGAAKQLGLELREGSA